MKSDESSKAKSSREQLDDMGKKLSKFHTTLQGRQALEHYQLWALVKLYYQRTKNEGEPDKKYVSYDDLMMTPCSSMWEYPLKVEDLKHALYELWHNDQVKVTRKTEKMRTHDISLDKINDYSNKELDYLEFNISIKGNIRVLSDLNKVLRYDDYPKALEKLDKKSMLARGFLQDVIKKLRQGDTKKNIDNYVLGYLLDAFNIFLVLKEILNM